MCDDIYMHVYMYVCDDIYIYIYIYTCVCLYIFTNSSARAGCDTRLDFKQSLASLNSEFSFSFQGERALSTLLFTYI